MSVYSPVNANDSPGGLFIPTDRFEIGQYVRATLANGRVELGQVTGFKENGNVEITTRQGYDVVVPPRNVKRAFLLVLDLNGVLVARGKGTCIHRPYVKEFMKFVFTNFVVAVWTSGLERSSDPVIESVFDGYTDRLLFRLYRDSCEPRATESNPWGTIKNLQLIFSRYPTSFHSVNTIIIDDSPDKCSHPDIALCPVPFKDAHLQKDDDGLRKTIEVLKEVLAVDSHAPVIRAAEERLAAIRAGEHGETEAALLKKLEGGVQAADPHATTPVDDSTGAPLAEVDLWKTRLCCDYLRGSCGYGSECRYCHEEDDHKRPCSRKGKCPYGHADRWVRTEGDAIVEKRRSERMRFYDKSEDYYLSERELRGMGRAGRMSTGIPYEDTRLEEEREREKVQRQQQSRRQQQRRNEGRGGGGQGRGGESSNASRVAPAVPSYPWTSSNTTTPVQVFSTDPNRNRGAAPVPTFSTNAAAAQQAPVDRHLQQLQQFEREREAYRASHPAGSGNQSASRSVLTSDPYEANGDVGRRANHSCRGRGARDESSWDQQPYRQQQQQPPATQEPHAAPGGGRAIHLVGNASDGSSLVRQLQALSLQKR